MSHNAQLSPHTQQSIVTHSLPLEKVVEGLNMVLSGKDSIKVALIPPE